MLRTLQTVVLPNCISLAVRLIPSILCLFQGRVEPNGTRDSTLEILVGDNGWVNHRENGILYSFDATKCMFSWGNLSEKLRMGNMACENEVVVDLFAGIGYFVLPFLVRYMPLLNKREEKVVLYNQKSILY